MDLTTFLMARLDEAEEAAKRVGQPYRLYACDDGCLEEPVRVSDLHGPRDGEYEQWSDGEDRLPNHHNSWALVYDPARALVDVEVKRRLLDEHRPAPRFAGHPVTCARCLTEISDSPGLPSLNQLHPCQTIRLLALPYADHADYRDEWRPE